MQLPRWNNCKNPRTRGKTFSLTFPFIDQAISLRTRSFFTRCPSLPTLLEESAQLLEPKPSARISYQCPRERGPPLRQSILPRYCFCGVFVGLTSQGAWNSLGVELKKRTQVSLNQPPDQANVHTGNDDSISVLTHRKKRVLSGPSPRPHLRRNPYCPMLRKQGNHMTPDSVV